MRFANGSRIGGVVVLWRRHPHRGRPTVREPPLRAADSERDAFRDRIRVAPAGILSGMISARGIFPKSPSEPSRIGPARGDFGVAAIEPRAHLPAFAEPGDETPGSILMGCAMPGGLSPGRYRPCFFSRFDSSLPGRNRPLSSKTANVFPRICRSRGFGGLRYDGGTDRFARGY